MISRIVNPVTKYARYGMLSCMLLVLTGTQPGFGKDLQWDNSVYTHYSDQEPLRSFLRALASSQKTPIIMSDKIDAVVSGYYRRKSPKEIFLNVVKSNGLVWYYDGDTLFVEREEEMQTGSVSLNNVTATEFTHSLERLGILDHRYQWVTSDVDRMVYFKGPEPFVTAVLEMSKVLDKKDSRPTIYSWVDEKGVTNFSSEVPEKIKNNKQFKVIARSKDHLELEKKPHVQ